LFFAALDAGIERSITPTRDAVVANPWIEDDCLISLHPLAALAETRERERAA